MSNRKGRKQTGYVPVASPHHVPLGFSPAGKLMSPEQAGDLLKSCPDPLATLHLVLALFAGLRVNEIARLRWAAFTPGESISVTFQESHPIAPMVLQCIRWVPVYDMLEAWLAPFYETNDAVFTDFEVRQRARVVLHAAGMSRPNHLRQTFLAYSLTLYRNDLREWASITDFKLSALQGRPFHPVSESDVDSLFALTPAAIGIEDWPDRGADALQQRYPSDPQP